MRVVVVVVLVMAIVAAVVVITEERPGAKGCANVAVGGRKSRTRPLKAVVHALAPIPRPLIHCIDLGCHGYVPYPNQLHPRCSRAEHVGKFDPLLRPSAFLLHRTRQRDLITVEAWGR